ncbi:hypothetical protein EUGRSUZ_D01150 [Eucalyptus grandis]|uniref:Uncharacterized protein n=2 Tax=Eucalyptus grandis TaxID=71139 RepID=A0ACC3L567_EUCGR|nr:hypothetical protein EUGRSUZ_D01150 [Eucalyptus grandis]
MEPCTPSVSGGAEAVLALQENSSISVAYHPLYGPHDDLILLELDEKLLDDVIHQRVFLRGHPDENAVLCTQSKTYAVKFVGTSNSVLLIPSSNQVPEDEASQDGNQKKCDHDVASVIKSAPGHLELVEIAPKLDKLKLLLSENPYKLEDVSAMEMEEIETEKIGLYRWHDLVNEMQASEEELKSGLKALSAVEIGGYWRLVDESCIGMILKMLLHNSVLNDWMLSALDEDEVLHVLEADGFPRMIAHHCLSVFGDKVDKGEGRSVWRLNERRVCVHYARDVLREGKMRIDNFIDEWKKRVPEEMVANFHMLDGEVLKEKLGVETWVRPFRVSSLPSDPSERFSILFKERPKWDGRDLEPYIRDLSVPGLSLEGLLLKFTRRVQSSPEAEPVFSAR